MLYGYLIVTRHICEQNPDNHMRSLGPCRKTEKSNQGTSWENTCERLGRERQSMLVSHEREKEKKERDIGQQDKMGEQRTESG